MTWPDRTAGCLLNEGGREFFGPAPLRAWLFRFAIREPVGPSGPYPACSGLGYRPEGGEDCSMADYRTGAAQPEGDPYTSTYMQSDGLVASSREH